MSINDKAVETLSGLGLTVLQAKVYMALAKDGQSTAKTIAKTSKIARQDLYRITPQLLNLGLIEKIIDTPTKFRAIPLKAASDILIERRKKEIEKLEHESKEILSQFESKEPANSKDDEAQFAIIKDMQSCMKKIKHQIANAETSISIVTKWVFFLTYTPEALEEYTQALKRGVHVHIISQAPKKTEVFPKNLQKLMKHPNFEVRFIPSLPSCLVAAFDKETDIFLASHKTPFETGMLVSNNTTLIELTRNYFDMMWQSGAICCFN